MGIYLNPGAESFREIINDDIYVDKTELIKYTNNMLNKKNKYICVSRPRRFGKTMAVSMLSAYYDCTTDAKTLFKNFKIAKNNEFEKYANKYNVISINMIDIYTRFKNDTEKAINYLQRIILKEIFKMYPNIDYLDIEDLVSCLDNVYEEKNIKFIILIDEWDCIFRRDRSGMYNQNGYLDFLRMLLKDKKYVALVYMTGILPIKKYGEHSALNMFTEFSMEQPKYLSEFVGFTSEEVRDLCRQHKMNYDECKAWYDGYLLRYKTLSEDREQEIIKKVEIYSPWSLKEALINRECRDYWTRTETYEALQIYIKLNMDGLKDKIIGLMSGDRYKINSNKFKNDMVNFESADDVLTLMVHLGYLGYDGVTREVFIPNHEVREQYATCIEDLVGWSTISEAIKSSDDLLAATIAGDSIKVAEFIEKAHVETSHLQYNDENALSYTLSLAYFTARRRYNIRREYPTGKGFADMVFLPLPHHSEMPPMLVELKWDKTAETAIDQIKNKQYTEGLKGYEGRILLVGVNYNKNTRKHECIIEWA